VPARAYRTAIIVRHDDKIIPTFKRIYPIREGRTEERRGDGRDSD
jgi:putative ABC transport system ATP-binding protein